MKRLHKSYDNLECVEHLVEGSTFTIKYAKSKSILSMVAFIIVWFPVMYGFHSVLDSNNLLDDYFAGSITVEYFIWVIALSTPLLALGVSIYKYFKNTEFKEYLHIDFSQKLIKIPYLNHESVWQEQAPIFQHTRYRSDNENVSEFNVMLENGERLPILHSVGYNFYYRKLEKALKEFGVDCEKVEVDETSTKKEKLKGLSIFFLYAGIPFLIFGFIAFFMIGKWGKQWEERKELVDSGQVIEEKAIVVKKFIDKRRSGDSTRTDYVIVLKQDEQSKTIRRTPPEKVWNSLSKDDVLSVYRFNEDFFIPITDVGGHNWAKWLFLAFGFIPMILFVTLRTYLKHTDQA